jgi:hypothetical protein
LTFPDFKSPDLENPDFGIPGFENPDFGFSRFWLFPILKIPILTFPVLAVPDSKIPDYDPFPIVDDSHHWHPEQHRCRSAVGEINPELPE